jgi:ribosomal-protein-alanine N-acetyltransferase
MPILETERLILRDFVASDWEALNAFLSEPEVTRYMHFSSWDEQKRRQWLASLVKRASNPHRDAYDWAITLRSNGLLIGWLILGRSRHATEEGMRECGCGYALNRSYWGQGYMPEALQAAFTYAFTVLGTRLIHAECERENTTSARVMQKCGMQYVGTIFDDDGLGNLALRDRYVITAESGKNTP